MLRADILTSVTDLGLISIKGWPKKQERMKLESVDIWVTADVPVAFIVRALFLSLNSLHTIHS